MRLSTPLSYIYAMRYLRYLFGLVLMGAYYLCCRTWLAHVVYYAGEHSTFLYGDAYFKSAVAADGIAAYADSWLAAMMAHATAGPLILAALCASVFYLADALIRAVACRPDAAALSVAASLATFIACTGIDKPMTAAWAAPLALAAALAVAAIVNRAVRRGPVRGFALLRGKGPWLWCAAAAAWCAWGYFHILGSINLSERAMLLTERAARRGDYDETIRRADTYLSQGRTNMLMSMLRNLALAKKGELPDRLLDYPMPFGAEGLSFAWKSDSRQSEYGAMPYEAVGHINEAYRWESEALVVWGATPRRLEALARYNIAMGRPEAAKIFIGLLAKAPFKGQEAARLMRMAESGEPDGLRHSLKGVGQTPAKWANVADITPELEAIMAADPENDTARQYLLCELLLRNEVSRFARLLPLLHQQGPLPRLYQEALMLATLVPGAGLPMESLIDSSVKQDFRKYMRMSDTGHPAILKEQFGNTYWYYLTHISPYGNTAK